MKLKEIRISRFLSMNRLARDADLSLSTIRDIEAGKHQPSEITCAKLASALGLPAEEIDECRERMRREGNKPGPSYAMAARA
jgi:DNA-binding XRE family transcriptional regulator